MVAAAAVARVINTEEGALRGIPTIIRLRHSLLSSDLGATKGEERRSRWGLCLRDEVPVSAPHLNTPHRFGGFTSNDSVIF